jgi:hypothetical protein
MDNAAPGKRTLYLIPFVANNREDTAIDALVNDYWREAVEQVEHLAGAGAPVRHLFHEGSITAGDEALAVLQQGNTAGYPHLRRLLGAGARLEPTEDVETLKATLDLHRCMSVVQASEKVADRLMHWFEETRQERYQGIAQRVNAALRTDGAGVLVISPDHQVQFAQDIDVLYVAPPALDRLTRWLREHPIAADGQTPAVPGADEPPAWAREDEPGA